MDSFLFFEPKTVSRKSYVITQHIKVIGHVNKIFNNVISLRTKFLKFINAAISLVDGYTKYTSPHRVFGSEKTWAGVPGN